MNNYSKNKNYEVIIYDSIDDIFSSHGKVQIDLEELRSIGISNILVKSQEYTKFTLILNKNELFYILNKDYSGVTKNILGVKGIYGYYGVSSEYYSDYAESKEFNFAEKYYIVVIEYEGEYLQVNSGSHVGMLIIEDKENNFNNIKFKSAYAFDNEHSCLEDRRN